MDLFEPHETNQVLKAFSTEIVRSYRSFEKFFSEADRLKAITYCESPKVLLNLFEEHGLEEMTVMVGDRSDFRSGLSEEGLETASRLERLRREGRLEVYVKGGSKAVHSKMYLIEGALKEGREEEVSPESVTVLVGSANLTKTGWGYLANYMTAFETRRGAVCTSSSRRTSGRRSRITASRSWRTSRSESRTPTPKRSGAKSSSDGSQGRARRNLQSSRSPPRRPSRWPGACLPKRMPQAGRRPRAERLPRSGPGPKNPPLPAGLRRERQKRPPTANPTARRLAGELLEIILPSTVLVWLKIKTGHRQRDEIREYGKAYLDRHDLPPTGRGYRLIPVALREHLWLRHRGMKKPEDQPCQCSVPGRLQSEGEEDLPEVFSSLHQAYMGLSEIFEKQRDTHGSNIYTKGFFWNPASQNWRKLDFFRGRTPHRCIWMEEDWRWLEPLWVKPGDHSTGDHSTTACGEIDG